MNKHFDAWNKTKQLLDHRPRKAFCHAREIWWCTWGINIGDEQNGRGQAFVRPVLVLKRFNENIFFGIALTGRKRDGHYYLYLGIIDGHESSVILSQVRTIDTKRLVRKMTTLDKLLYQEVCIRLKKILF